MFNYTSGCGMVVSDFQGTGRPGVWFFVSMTIPIPGLLFTGGNNKTLTLGAGLKRQINR